jgi:hypothetical protein
MRQRGRVFLSQRYSRTQCLPDLFSTLPASHSALPSASKSGLFVTWPVFSLPLPLPFTPSKVPLMNIAYIASGQR